MEYKNPKGHQQNIEERSKFQEPVLPLTQCPERYTADFSSLHPCQSTEARTECVTTAIRKLCQELQPSGTIPLSESLLKELVKKLCAIGEQQPDIPAGASHGDQYALGNVHRGIERCLGGLVCLAISTSAQSQKPSAGCCVKSRAVYPYILQ